MLNQTKQALAAFDNQHDFERMGADILNALGYQEVEPMAPGGGSDGGKDIKFKDGDAPSIAFVTLDKSIESKFADDLAKQKRGKGTIALFCNVNLSPDMKVKFSKAALKKGYTFVPYDLERLRSLLDTSLKEIRYRYLKIDDEVAARVRSSVQKLLRFPDAMPDSVAPPTLIETLLVDKVPRRLFQLLVPFEEKDIIAVPGIGAALQKHLGGYYQFREGALRIESDLFSRIGAIVTGRLPAAWRIYLQYIWMRSSGLSKETIVAGGNFLNFGITWDDAERVFLQLSGDAAVSSEIAKLLALHAELSRVVAELRKPAD